MKLFHFTLPFVAATLLVGCTNGFVPPDPIGRALFGAVEEINDGVLYEPTESVVYEPMPQNRWERRPARPVGYRDPVYVDGYWTWGGNDWVWVPGEWVERPRPGYRWVEPTAVRTARGWRWRSGYWGRI